MTRPHLDPRTNLDGWTKRARELSQDLVQYAMIAADDNPGIVLVAIGRATSIFLAGCDLSDRDIMKAVKAIATDAMHYRDTTKAPEAKP